MTHKSFYVNDNYINTTIYDDSTIIPTEPVLPKRMTILQPIFASKGKSNKIMDFSSSSLVKSTYGNDMENLNKFGQGGINIIHAMGGGASAQICRLLPENAETASLLVKLVLTEKSIEVYQRDQDGEYILDSENHKIPVVVKTMNGSGTETESPKVVNGLESKIIVEACDPTSVAIGKATVDQSDPSKHIIPLYRLVHNGPGKCGNAYGHTISNDFERDDSVTDGRRYIMSLFEKDSNNNVSAYGDKFYFSLNPDALLVEGSEVYENLKYVFGKKDAAGNERAVRCDPFIMENYEYLKTLISKYSGNVDPNEIDIINCLDETGYPYENFIVSEDADHCDFTDGVYYLRGGSDGSLQLGHTYEVVETPGGEKILKTVDEAEVLTTKKALLKSFFYGQIDPAIFDERLVVSDIVFDADYDFETVKPAMLGKFRDIRPDIMVIADIGRTAKNSGQAVNLIKSVYGMVDGSAGYTAAVMAQSGTTTDRALPLNLTGTYDYSYGLAKCYGSFGTFSVFAGFLAAKVETMEFDWYPYKDEYDTMIGPLKKHGCIFAIVIDRTGTTAYMSEENMYVLKNSKLKSIRNGMVIGDAVRLAKSILIKYVYDNDGAEGAIRKATDEISQTILGRYPKNISVTPSLYQTTRDVLMESTTCDLTYRFPGMTKDWKLNIYAKRSDN